MCIQFSLFISLMMDILADSISRYCVSAEINIMEQVSLIKLSHAFLICILLTTYVNKCQ